MNLEADELPSTQNHTFNLFQIGFVPYRSFPCFPLLWKTLFTLTFCFTLRQQNHSLDTSICGIALDDSISARTNIIWKCINLTIKIVIRLWVWNILFIIFIYAVQGDRVTVFRTIYMGLFLVFVVLFQVSVYYYYLVSCRIFFGIYFSNFSSQRVFGAKFCISSGLL